MGTLNGVQQQKLVKHHFLLYSSSCYPRDMDTKWFSSSFVFVIHCRIIDAICFSIKSIFPLINNRFSKLDAVSEDLLALRTSDAVLKSLSTAAELGRGVLYLINNFTKESLCSEGNISRQTVLRRLTFLASQLRRRRFILCNPSSRRSSKMAVSESCCLKSWNVTSRDEMLYIKNKKKHLFL